MADETMVEPDSRLQPGLAEAVGAVERLAGYAADQEYRLSSLLGRLERNAGSMLAASTSVALPATVSTRDSTNSPQCGPSIELLPALRELHGAAREQRHLACTLLMRLGGPAAHVSAAPAILVVDDDPDTREVLAVMLEALGLRVIEASNGLEGLIAAHAARPDLVLMDIAMPVLNGLEAARLLKASASTRDLNVIAHTATPDLFETASAAAFVDVLRKPASQDAILAAIRRFLPRFSPAQSGLAVD